MDDVVVTFKVDVEDWIAYSLFAIERYPGVGAAQKRVRGLLFGTGLFVGFLGYVLFSLGSLWAFLASIIGGGFVAAALQYGTKKSNSDEVRKLFAADRIVATRTEPMIFTLGEHSVSTNWEGAVSAHLWRDITHFGQTDDYTFFFRGANHGYFVPHRAFASAEEKAAFDQRVKECMPADAVRL